MDLLLAMMAGIPQARLIAASFIATGLLIAACLVTAVTACVWAALTPDDTHDVEEP